MTRTSRKHIRSWLLGVLYLFIACLNLPAQINREKFILHVHKTQHPVTVDGVLQEPCWQEAEKAADFFRILPIDTGLAKAQTVVMVSYDDNNLFFGIICYDPTPGKRPVESLRRDFKFPLNDNFLIFMDTYNDYTNGFSFGVSAAGAQWDGIQANGGYVSLNWDSKWRSAVKSYPDRWVAEFAIPFHSIRYRKGSQTWGINFSRPDLKTNEKSSWAPVPRQFQSANLGADMIRPFFPAVSVSPSRFLPAADSAATSTSTSGSGAVMHPFPTCLSFIPATPPPPPIWGTSTVRSS